MSVPLTVRREGAMAGTFAASALAATGLPLRGASVRTVQVNVGLRCNLACHHCHVESSPKRKEEMSWETMQLALAAATKLKAAAVDVTGGAPEMHPRFRDFVLAARAADLQVILRTNLTILLAERYRDLPAFLKQHRVQLVASLPCYLKENVDAQRGRGVYSDSIEAIQMLNAIGYGIEPTLPLDLVYNPVGPSLPPRQDALERDYKRELADRFGIRFTQLLVITNMPIGRFLRDLERQGKADAYWTKLRDAFNPGTLGGLMCRHQLHVGWDGTLHDCDFNYALKLRVTGDTRAHIRDFDASSFLRRRIAVGEHCFGCTAGNGSSCGGALV